MYGMSVSCRVRLKVVVTKVPSFQLVYIDEFATKDELIDACMASAHIPFFLDWKATATYRCACWKEHCPRITTHMSLQLSL